MNGVSLKLIINISLFWNFFTPVLQWVVLSLYPPVCPGLCTCYNLEQSPNKCLLLLPCDPFSCLLPNLLSTSSIPLDESQSLASLKLSRILRLLDTTLCSPQASSLAQPSFTTANLWTLDWKAEMEGDFLFFLIFRWSCAIIVLHGFLSPILIQLTPTFSTESLKS